MAEVLLGIIVKLFSISVWPQSKGIHKPRSELLAELASAPRRLHLVHLHPVEAEANGASLPARAQAELASAPRRHLPVDHAGGKESSGQMFTPLSQYVFVHLCGEAEPRS
jgi:hypothetical protein